MKYADSSCSSYKMLAPGWCELGMLSETSQLLELKTNKAKMAEALLCLTRSDGAVIPLLSRDDCRAFVESSLCLHFRRAKAVVGEAGRTVRQDFELCLEIPGKHALWRLARAVEGLVSGALDHMDERPLLAFEANDLVIQRYFPGSAGITSHRDHVSYVGLVAIVQLTGDGNFYLCDDRAGTSARRLSSRPGDLILMRGPGFNGCRERPFHYLDGVTRERYSFGIRQKATSMDSEP